MFSKVSTEKPWKAKQVLHFYFTPAAVVKSTELSKAVGHHMGQCGPLTLHVPTFIHSAVTVQTGGVESRVGSLLLLFYTGIALTQLFKAYPITF